jgi:hypothetical protein
VADVSESHANGILKFGASLVVTHKIGDTLTSGRCKPAVKLFKYVNHKELRFTK